MRVKPQFSCDVADINGQTVTASFAYRVDKSGSATVSLVKSTGNTKLDKQWLLQARTARFTPFTNAQGVPVVGTGTLPFSCTPPK